MAQPVYSLRLFAHGGITPGGGTIGPVVPAGVVWVVRDIDAFNHTSVAGDSLFVFNQVTGVLVAFSLASSTAPLNYPWRGRQVYAEGEQIGLRSFQGTWSAAISGYQLTLP
jgi:hypothetical protein